MEPEGVFVAEGRGGILLAVGGVILAIAFALPFAMVASGTPIGNLCGQIGVSGALKMWGMAAAVAALFAVFGGYYYSRRLTFDGSVLRFTSWITDQAWDVSRLGALSWRMERAYSGTSNSMPEQYIELWDVSSRKVGEISTRGWDTPAFQAVFKAVAARRPLSLAPEVAGFLADPDAAWRIY